mmetsp:Transcript_58788/g.127166  ORF Transcript_58788/g.127166 Transcript_58788/m.127166 type:complete len:242 (-) Transcript_58788:1650-2375(-)
MQAHDGCDNSKDCKIPHAGIFVANLEEGHRDPDASEEHQNVQVVLSRQIQCPGVKVAIQLAEGDETPGERHCSDDVSENGRDVGSRNCSIIRLIEGADGSACGCSTDQRVEEGNGLGQCHGADALASNQADNTSACKEPTGQGQDFLFHCHESRCNCSEHPHNAKLAAAVRRANRSETTDSSHTEDSRDSAHCWVELRAKEQHHNQQNAWHQHPDRVVLLARLPEEVEHALRDDEATEDVD